MLLARTMGRAGSPTAIRVVAGATLSSVPLSVPFGT